MAIAAGCAECAVDGVDAVGGSSGGHGDVRKYGLVSSLVSGERRENENDDEEEDVGEQTGTGGGLYRSLSGDT